MLFNSLDFAIFFPIVIITYWTLSSNLKVRNLFLLFSSYFFYAWWDWRFLGLIVFSSLIDYILGLAISKTKLEKQKKILVSTSIFVNLGFLFFFKYFNFFVISFVDAFKLFGTNLEVSTLHIVLPVGISFYTFQTLSYTIDIYRDKIKPTKNVINFFAFVSFFPQLVAGPIERASNLLPQFSEKHYFDYSKFKSGLLLICWGLIKKMIIADRAAIVVNEVYNNVENYNSLYYVYATILFAFQIYCDFSAYSDIAIGISRTMGFDLMKNFKTPYFSKSLTEFWRRWHISLSTWFRDYVYIPLGGSKKGNKRMYFNLFLVFLISGIWHGAAWTFVSWGIIHGVIIVLEKLSSNFRKIFFLKLGLGVMNFANKLFFVFVTFFIVCVSWVFFRANSFNDALLIFKKALIIKEYSFDFKNSEIDFFNIKTTFICIFILVIIEFIHNRKNLYKVLQKQGFVFRWGTYILAVLAILIFGVYGEYDDSQFIYFQF
ncbi:MULTISPECIES: MBOAT family O-acyltransferase [Aquimarina]|uniref:MBOAT family protein n=1 Tax=Aquimarina algiphila TaxID=2047982 RepID=A0A554VG04_9FLAO|nr:MULTISPECIES: MBOAT family O-acyltransferase [Aquimarina]TSE06281.1 MBOAT family protein [Aquimarina algiphila]